MPTADVPRLLDLVEHAETIDVEASVTHAQAEFVRRHRRFLGVVSAGKFVGVASAREITELLSNKFGHALFGRTPVGRHIMTNALVVASDLALTELIQVSSARAEDTFEHDIAVVSPGRDFLGLIPLPRIVRLQTRLLLDNLARVEAQRIELARRNRMMEEDLRMAREMQLALLPGRPAVSRTDAGTVEVRHYYEPADLIGGDFFSIFSPRPGVTICCIFDVMGHGVRPALVTAILRAFIEERLSSAEDPGAMLTHLNQSLQRVLRASGELIFVTAGYAVIDLGRGLLCYSQAGHPAPLLWRTETHATQPLELDAETDGILEAATADGAEFGPKRLGAAVAAAMKREEEDAAAALAAEARSFTGASRFPDDVCVLVARCLGVPAAAEAALPATS